MDGKAPGVFLGPGRIERDPVEQRFLLHVLARRLDAHLPGDLAEDVGPVHAVDEALVVGGLLYHAPAPELREPPHAVRLQWEVRLAIEEGHVVLVLLLAAVAVVVVAEQAAEDDLLRAIDVLRLGDDLGHPRTVLELVVPLACLDPRPRRPPPLRVVGFLVAPSAVKGRPSPGGPRHICSVAMAVKPMPSAIARAFHGSPTQNPSILPTFMLATICAGGIVMSETSRSGL